MQGWAGSVPPHWDAERADDVWTIEDDEALEMTRRLAREEGIFAGTSSGANVVGALRLAEQLGENDVVVTLAVDSGFKYMTGPPYFLAPLAPRFVEEQSRRNAHVQRLDLARERNRDRRVTRPADERAHALPFGAEDQHRPAGEVRRPERLSTVARRGVDPEIRPLISAR